MQLYVKTTFANNSSFIVDAAMGRSKNLKNMTFLLKLQRNNEMKKNWIKFCEEQRWNETLQMMGSANTEPEYVQQNWQSPAAMVGSSKCTFWLEWPRIRKNGDGMENAINKQISSVFLTFILTFISLQMIWEKIFCQLYLIWKKIIFFVFWTCSTF